jgi:hypothetical protein
MKTTRGSLLLAALGAVALGVAAALPVSASPEPAGPGGPTADAVVLTAIGTLGDDVVATTDLAAAIDPTHSSTQHYGPYASGSPDSGTCGNDWAEDTFNRVFTVHSNSDGTFTVVEQFKDGAFTTNFGPSPGGCETNPGGTVNQGVTGSMHGYFVIPMPAGSVQTSTSPDCVVGDPTAPCTTAGFIDSHFTPCYGAYVCSATTYFDHYVATGQGLVYHEWKNASADRGGDKGDIANT